MQWKNNDGSHTAWIEALGSKELCVEADHDGGFVLLLIGAGDDEFISAHDTLDDAKAAGDAYADKAAKEQS